MESERAHGAKLEEILAAFNESWVKYWESYVRLQDQLYESLRAGREVSWLAATDDRKLSEINQVQRELFSGMPRRLDYSPLGQISRNLNTAPTKIADLEAVLALPVVRLLQWDPRTNQRHLYSRLCGCIHSDGYLWIVPRKD